MSVIAQCGEGKVGKRRVPLGGGCLAVERVDRVVRRKDLTVDVPVKGCCVNAIAPFRRNTRRHPETEHGEWVLWTQE